MENIEDIKLSQEEEAKISELKIRLSEEFGPKITEDTFFMRRLLNVNDFNVNQAESMCHDIFKWRRRIKADLLLTDYEPPEALDNYIKNSRICFSKTGAAVHYLPIEKLDHRGFSKVAKPYDLDRFAAYVIEKDIKELQKHIKYHGGPHPGYIYICDLDKFSFANASDKKVLENTIRISKIHQNCYPDLLETIYIINVSPFLPIVISILKTFLSNSFLKKIKILDSNWKKDLLNLIDADVLPAFLGGNRTDPDGDPQCKTIVIQGGKIDEKYYLHEKRESLLKLPGTKKLSLDRASFSEIEIYVAEAGSAIEWKFETKIRDIGFGLFYKEMNGDEEKITAIVPLDRINTEDYPETGIYQCNDAGTYVLLFDNSYSWVRSKEIFYQTNVVSPKEFKTRM